MESHKEKLGSLTESLFFIVWAVESKIITTILNASNVYGNICLVFSVALAFKTKVIFPDVLISKLPHSNVV